jgi:S1-C subfamily serine protease
MFWWAADVIEAPPAVPVLVQSIRQKLVQFGDGPAAVLGVVVDVGGGVLSMSPPASVSRVTGTTPDGTAIEFRVTSRDAISGLSLLTPASPSPWSRATQPVSLATGASVLNRTLYAISPLATQALSSGARTGIGIVQPENRFVPLTELTLEKPDDKIGGALIFNDRGELAGIVQASLEPAVKPNNVAGARKAQSQEFGPKGITVAYSIAPSMLSRVVRGFRTPERTVPHPSIGVQLGSTPGSAGARVLGVTPDGPAAFAGLEVNDVIVASNEQRVADHLAMALEMSEWNPGQVVVLEVSRPGRGLNLQIRIRVGRYQPLRANKVAQLVPERAIVVESVDERLKGDVNAFTEFQPANVLPGVPAVDFAK